MNPSSEKPTSGKASSDYGSQAGGYDQLEYTILFVLNLPTREPVNFEKAKNKKSLQEDNDCEANGVESILGDDTSG